MNGIKIMIVIDKVNDALRDDYIEYVTISAKKIGKVIENVIKQSTVISNNIKSIKNIFICIKYLSL